MVAKAKHWVNYNGEWHAAGETFEVEAADAESMKQYAEIEEETNQQQEPAKRGRKRKTEE